MHMHGCSSVWSWSSFVPRRPPVSVLLTGRLYITQKRDVRMGRKDCLLVFFFVLYFKKLNIHCPLQAVSTRSCSSSFSIFLLLQTILTPRSQARLGSGLSHSWAHCRAARLSRNQHSCQWTWDPEVACLGHPAVDAHPHGPDSRKKLGPHSCHRQLEVGFGKEGKALKASLDKRPINKAFVTEFVVRLWFFILNPLEVRVDTSNFFPSSGEIMFSYFCYVYLHVVWFGLPSIDLRIQCY